MLSRLGKWAHLLELVCCRREALLAARPTGDLLSCGSSAQWRLAAWPRLRGARVMFTIPVRVKNPLNGAQWGRSGLARSSRRSKEREATRLCFIAAGGRDFVANRHGAPVITLTRVAPRAFDDDGLAASLKSIRDSLAQCLGVSDGPKGPQWIYRQRRGKVREHLIEVTIE